MPLASWPYFLIENALEWIYQEVRCTGRLYHFMVDFLRTQILKWKDFLNERFKDSVIRVRHRPKIHHLLLSPLSVIQHLIEDRCDKLFSPQKWYSAWDLKKTCRSVGKTVRWGSSRTVQNSFMTLKGGRTHRVKRTWFRNGASNFSYKPTPTTPHRC